METEREFYCPLCGDVANVVQVDIIDPEPDDVDVPQWHRVHLECKGVCDLLWSCVDVPFGHHQEAQVSRSTPVTNLDNRDVDTTWLWLTPTRYVEVNIPELANNAHENLNEHDEYPLEHIALMYESYWHTPELTDRAVVIVEQITESIHQGFDGWTELEQLTINKYLNDIGLAVSTVND